MATQSDFPPAIEIEPFLADMERKLGMKVNAFFAPDYAGIIQPDPAGRKRMTDYFDGL